MKCLKSQMTDISISICGLTCSPHGYVWMIPKEKESERWIGNDRQKGSGEISQSVYR